MPRQRSRKGVWACGQVVHVEVVIREEFGVCSTPATLVPALDDDMVGCPARAEVMGKSDPAAGGYPTLT